MKQLYTRITSERHPQATGEGVAITVNSPLVRADKTDIKIAGEIVEIYRRLNFQLKADGEWKWINEKGRPDYIGALRRGDKKELASILANMFRNDATFGVSTGHIEELKDKEKVFELENSILLDSEALKEFDPDWNVLPWIKNWKRCGNIYGYYTKDGVISGDAPRHRYYANKIMRLAEDIKKPKVSIFEIGGGYGGLCLDVMSLKAGKKIKFINCDLTETLNLFYYFIRKMLPSRKVLWAIDNIPEADIILVPSEKKHLVKQADIVFNANSFSEMKKKTMQEYVHQINQLKPFYFLHQNSNYLLFPDSKRHIETLVKDFPVDKKLFKEVYRCLTPWQGAGGRYREFLYKKIQEIDI